MRGPDRYGDAMRVVQCSALGPLSGLAVVEQASPTLARGSLRLTVTATGVNYVDGLIVQGL